MTAYGSAGREFPNVASRGLDAFAMRGPSACAVDWWSDP